MTAHLGAGRKGKGWERKVPAASITQAARLASEELPLSTPPPPRDL